MKRISTLLFALGAFASASQAQGVYFKAGGGYAIPIATDQVGQNYRTDATYDGNISTYEPTTEVVSGSYGAGMNFSIGGGYMFNEFLGVELNVQYSKSNKIETSDIYTYVSPTYTEDDRTIAQNFASAVYINPSFVITPGVGTKVPYGRFGVIVGSPTIKGEETTTDKISYYPEPSRGSRKWEYTGGLTFGFQGAVGMNWMLTDKIDLFTEVNFISMTYYAEEYNLTEYISDGYDYLPDTPEYYKRTLFKDKIKVEGEPSDTSVPKEELRKGTAFSSLSFQVGISFLLKGHGEN